MVSADRLWHRHEKMAQIGATGRGGVCRLALSPEDTAARALLINWSERLGLAATLDPVGNLFLRREGREPDLLPLWTGSHLDTQPTGGKYDGIYGVLAGLEVLEGFIEKDIATRRPIELVVWADEEGARFQPATMGSAVHAGAITLEDALNATDASGATFGAALAVQRAALSGAGPRPLGRAAFAYVEAHIEQGPVLEAEGRVIGAVTGIQGLRQFAITVEGEEAHAGTTPASRRKDAFATTHRIVGALYKLVADPSEITRFTIGRFMLAPGSPNTVPARVEFTIDLRHPDAVLLDRITHGIAEICRSEASPCTAEVRQILDSSPVVFAPAMVERVRRATRRLGLEPKDILSGATHDAKFMAGLCPTAMIFIPCRGGVSHNEAEAVEPEHLAAGAEVLAEVLRELAEE
ncbi:MAG TPA: Zn-dependent hydrolase [Alphaproteobacteria bacterium]|nr:Zn-dependent hydrolase [Alphaproteobacteria bacterium]